MAKHNNNVTVALISACENGINISICNQQINNESSIMKKGMGEGMKEENVMTRQQYGNNIKRKRKKKKRRERIMKKETKI